MDGRPSLRTALGNPRLIRVLGAYAGSVIGEWALWVAVLVYAYQEGGSGAAGATSIGLLIPTAVVAPFAGRVADGARPARVLFIVFSIVAASLAGAGLLALLGAPMLAVIGAVGVAVTGITFIRPAISVVVPDIVVSPSDLVAANLLTGNADSLSVLAGPLLASALFLIDGPALVFAVCALFNMAGAALIFGIDDPRMLPPAAVPTAVLVSTGQPAGSEPAGSEPASSEPARRTVSLIQAARTMATQRGSTPLLVVLGAQYALIGALDLLTVNLAFAVLDLGAAGPGLLSALFGVGAVAGGAASVMIVGRRQLSIVMIVSLGVVTASMAALGASTVIVTTLLVLPVVGVARSLIDLCGRMLLQRCAPQDALASVFAILELLSVIGMLCGSVMVQVLIARAGLGAALFGVATFFGLVLMMTAHGLRHAEAHADAPVVEIRLLRNTSLFSSLPGPVLESLARGTELIEFAKGAQIVRQGDPGRHYFVMAGGTAEVVVDDALVRRISRPAGFGEIALLADLPRTATVTAIEPVSVLAIERSQFLAAVSGHSALATAAWSHARRLHPSMTTMSTATSIDATPEPDASASLDITVNRASTWTGTRLRHAQQRDTATPP